MVGLQLLPWTVLSLNTYSKVISDYSLSLQRQSNMWNEYWLNQTQKQFHEDLKVITESHIPLKWMIASEIIMTIIVQNENIKGTHIVSSSHLCLPEENICELH